MASRGEVNTDLITTDKTKAGISSATQNLREMGEKVSQLGMRMSAVLTLPVVGALTMIGKFASSANKQVEDARKNLADAITSKDVDKINQANAAWMAIPDSVKQASDAYTQFQMALQPARAELQGAAADILTGLIPVLRDLTPTIRDMAAWVHDTAAEFAALPKSQKETILFFVGLAAAAGPAVVVFGQVINTLGTIQMLAGGIGIAGPAAGAGLRAIGAGAYAALGPVGALILALGVLYTVWQKFGGQAQTTLNQMGLLAGRAVFGDEAFRQAIKTPEVPVLGKPTGASSGSPVVVQIQQTSAVSLGNKEEAQSVLFPMILDALHKAGFNPSG